MKAIGIVLLIVGGILILILYTGYFAKAISIFKEQPVFGALCILCTAACLVLGGWIIAHGQSLSPPTPGPGPCPGLSSCPNLLSSGSP
jgi:4-hydroxybenzoate polyprenyltransferase